MDKNKARQVVAGAILVGFLASLIYIFKVAVSDNSFDPKDILMLMLGALTAKFGTIVDWFFGTSESSELKTMMMYESISTPKRIKDDED